MLGVGVGGYGGGGVLTTLLALSGMARQHMLFLACAPFHTCHAAVGMAQT